jgi:GxxExxY protein
MLLELRKMNLSCEKQKPIKVSYHNTVIGEYFADIIVDNLFILELKAAENICTEHELQLINYLKAMNIEVGLLLNFGKEPQFKRKIFTNDRKSVQIS